MNSFLNAMFHINDASKCPQQPVLRTYLCGSPFIQRHFAKGVLTGAVKG
ncbi:MAG TPA: hypothetical protein VIP98_18760 [Microlunatus sp.]